MGKIRDRHRGGGELREQPAAGHRVLPCRPTTTPRSTSAHALRRVRLPPGRHRGRLRLRRRPAEGRARRSTWRRSRRRTTRARCYPKLPRSNVVVEMGPVLDGVAEHMRDYPPEQTFVVAERRPADVAEVLRRSGAEVVVNYLPVGSQAGDRALRAAPASRRASSLVNCIPVVHRLGPAVGARVRAARASRSSATTSSRRSAPPSCTACSRSCSTTAASVLDRTYQLNTGGNTDFLNMLNRARTGSKRRLEDRGGAERPARAAAAAARSTSARATTCPGSATTRSASSAWRDAASATRRSSSSCASRSRTAPTRPAASSTPSAAAASRATAAIGGAARRASSAYLMKHPPRQLPDDHRA